MALWKFKIEFVEKRECAVEAETEEEAREKMESGDWAYEDTYEFYENNLIEGLNGPHKETD